MCGEHWQALGYEVSRAYKRRFTMFMAIADVSVKSIYIRFDIYNESHIFFLAPIILLLYYFR